MLHSTKIEKILFIDIETVPQLPEFEMLTPRMKDFWVKKAGYLKKEGVEPADLYDRAGIYAEFGKIICISAGYFVKINGKRQFRLRSFSGDEEREILKEFSQLLNVSFPKNEFALCAHNGKEFDFPYLARRLAINDLEIPPVLNAAGMKPWETSFIDTLEMWKFGDYKNYISLDLLATVLGIETPKDDITGSDVCRVYWQDKNLSRISHYCMKDVITVARIYLRLKRENQLADNEIIVT